MSLSIDVAEPEGTCVPLPGRPGWWAVRGRKQWYEVSLEWAVCDCGDFVHRKSKVRQLCRHLQMLAAYMAICLAFETPAKSPTKEPSLPSQDELKTLFA